MTEAFKPFTVFLHRGDLTELVKTLKGVNGRTPPVVLTVGEKVEFELPTSTYRIAPVDLGENGERFARRLEDLVSNQREKTPVDVSTIAFNLKDYADLTKVKADAPTPRIKVTFYGDAGESKPVLIEYQGGPTVMVMSVRIS